MPKFIEKHKSRQKLTTTEDLHEELRNWVFNEVDDSLNLRRAFDNLCKECLRMYEGVPKLETRDTPIENAPNIEVTVGAIAVDTINAQAVDMMFNVSPFLTVRPVPKKPNDDEATANAKALQRFANHIASDDLAGLREAAETAVLEDVQLGTGIIYTPWVERVKKTKTAKVLSSGPKFFAIPIEDVIVPLGAKSDIEALPLIGIRFYKTLTELNGIAKKNDWDLEGIQPISHKNEVRMLRENLGRNYEPANRRNVLYDLIYLQVFFDIDGDGIDEDLLVIYNHSGRKIIDVMYNPMDRRPISKMVYQLRAHVFYGLGVLQMIAPYEEKLSDISNYATLNVLLANSRMWVGSEGLPSTMKIWPSKYVQTANPREDLQALNMADVYPSIWQDLMITMQLANQRVGINDVSRGSNIPSRTPGITAMSFLQQVNKRFVPAFDSMRACIAGAIKQALYRYQEHLLMGDESAERNILAILGEQDGVRVIKLLKDETFDEQVAIELTAASASINKEADRQDAIMLMNVLGQYYQRTLELTAVVANPETPPEVKKVATRIINSASEMIDRTIRTFDQVKDPGQFIIDFNDELSAQELSVQDQEGLGQLLGLLSQPFQQPPGWPPQQPGEGEG